MFKCDPECKAECCGVMPINHWTIEVERENFQVPVIEEEKADLFKGKNHVLIHTADGKCVFLNRETWKCAIYQRRPLVCQSFGQTTKFPCYRVRTDGTLRSEAERKHLQKVIDRKYKDKIAYVNKYG